MEGLRVTVIGVSSSYNAEHFFVKALRSLGHSVEFVDQYQGVDRKFLTRFLSTRFPPYRFRLSRLPVNRRELGNPDLVLVFKGELLTDYTLSRLSQLNSYLFYPDTYRFPSILRGRLHHFQGVLVTTERTFPFIRMGARRVFTVRWACDPEFHRPLPEGKVYDVSFVGTFYPNRWSLLRRLRVKPHVFGSFWYLKAGYRHPPVFGEEYVRVLNRTKVNLNVHHPVDLAADAPNMRTFEVAGTGGFLLTERMECIPRLFRRVETYSSVEDLNEKLAYYLEDEKERREVGESLRRDCVERHTYLHRAEEILRLV